MKKQIGLLVCVVWLVCGLRANAWRPAEWVFFQGSYAYPVDEGGWYYMNAGDTMWCYSYQSGTWSRLGQNAMANGWDYFQWPYVYSIAAGGWYYCSEADVMWCYSYNDQAWSHLGVPSLPLYDDFSGSTVNAGNWHIPTWLSPTDGTFVGQTQFRCIQNAPLPVVSNSNAIIALDTYNPTGSGFYGTDLIGNQLFTLGRGITVTVRAKMNAPIPAGVVGGIFLYAPPAGTNNAPHDEIDFELLGNDPNHVWTNIYGNEPLGAGHPATHSYASGSATDYHTYQIRWLPNQVSWYLDDALIRTVTNQSPVPAGPMYVHLNMWVPGSDFTAAYNPSLHWTNAQSFGQTFSMSVDWVSVNR